MFQAFNEFVHLILQASCITLFLGCEMNECTDEIDSDEIASKIEEFMDKTFPNVHMPHDDGDDIYDGDHKLTNFIQNERDNLIKPVKTTRCNDLKTDLKSMPFKLNNFYKEKSAKSLKKVNSKPKSIKREKRGPHGATNNFVPLANYFSFINALGKTCRYNCVLCNKNKNVRVLKI